MHAASSKKTLQELTELRHSKQDYLVSARQHNITCIDV